MKKIIILIFATLLLSGCYDYQELNNLAIVSGVSIDYEEEKFVVGLEILSTKKEAEEDSSKKSITIKGTGDTIGEAFKEAGLKTTKEVYLRHIKTVIVSESLAKENVKSTFDYIVRSPNISDAFYILMTKENAYSILETKNEQERVVSEYIKGLLDYSSNIENSSIVTEYEDFTDTVFKRGTDAYMPIIEIAEDDDLELEGLAIFRKRILVKTLDKEETVLLKLLINDSKSYVVTDSCVNDEKKRTAIGLYDNKIKYEITEDKKIKITGEFNGSIVEDDCELELRKPETYTELEERFPSVIKERIEKYFETAIKEDFDPIGIRKMYYNKYREMPESLSEFTLDSVEISLKVNKNGLIFGGEAK